MRSFCVECGKEAEHLLDGMCIDCYVKQKELVEVPGRIRLILCPFCGSVKHKNEWKRKDFGDAVKEIIEDAISISPNIEKRKLSVAFKRKGKTLYDCEITLEGEVKGKQVKRRVWTELLVEKNLCLTCSRKAGKYFEAIVQIRTGRSEEGRFQEVLDKIKGYVEDFQREGREVFITEIKRVRGGIDVYLSDNHSAKKIAQALYKKYGGEKKVSPKLVGMKDGKRIYRITYLVRLPQYDIGDILSRGEEIFYVKSMDGKKVHLIDLISWVEVTYDRNFMKGFSVVGDHRMIRDAIVVSQSRKEVQIMDPESYETIDLRKPKVITFGKTTKVVKVKDRLFLLPVV